MAAHAAEIAAAMACLDDFIAAFNARDVNVKARSSYAP